MPAHIFQLNCSAGGVPKLAVREAELTPTGLVGDQQRKLDIHGGPDRALCLYSLERIMTLQAEGHPIFPGSIGENITIAGLDWAVLKLGSRLQLGPDVLIELTSYTVPCNTIRESFHNDRFKRISQKTHPGDSRYYARVLQTGHLVTGQPVRLLPAGEPSGR